MVSILSNVSSSRKQSLFQVEVCKKEKVWYVVTVLVNTICSGILVSCVSVRGINVLIIKKIKKMLLKCERFERLQFLSAGVSVQKPTLTRVRK